MPSVRFTDTFKKAFLALGPAQRQRTTKSIQLFIIDPRHRSLHFEKLAGSRYRTIRVDRNHRIALREAGDGQFDLLDVGGHDYIYRRFG